MKKESIIIIGAGIAGCFTAILLAKRGYQVEIYERSSQEEIEKNSSKKSFNLTCFGYAVNILKETGLWQEIEPKVIQLDGSITQVSTATKPILSTFDKNHLPYYTIQRNELVAALVRHAKKQKNITFHFNATIKAIDKEIKKIDIQTEGKIKKIIYDRLLGADGVHSAVRTFMQKGEHANLLQEELDWKYKQITFSKNTVEKLSLDTKRMHAWTRHNAILLAFPQKNESFAAIFILPNNINSVFEALMTEGKIKVFIENNFPDLLPALPEITSSILHNPEGRFVMIHTTPWYYKDSIAIIGDAAHGFYPFFGQGMSAAFGDALALTHLLDTYADNWEKVLPAYQETRKKHMDTLGDLSKAGFARYRRTKKADYNAIYERLESLLHQLFPQFIQQQLFIPIAIDPDHTADYAEKQKKQRKILNTIGLGVIARLLSVIIATQEK